MIRSEDIKKLASLSRIELTEEEETSFVSEIDSILGYVGQIGNLEAPASTGASPLRNVFRADERPHETGEFTERILAEAPSREGQYVKVKKILQND